ncbi:flagellar hook-length control protein FliK [Pelagibacterium xiamenense]|uniref:flagellar hook-length control protein FliK n=1 Tax=Pelagibacterium xiamenense TaxID=2901140 RepID=UPI001E333BCA|nr:flagellar hook-length control protein FliK [Pelagibacterium xiamenense]MCD7060728.1 flagellar hook-length control protein FliK [Pelagibacterium xiamenense]
MGPRTGQNMAIGGTDMAGLTDTANGSVEETFAALLERFGAQTPASATRAGGAAPIMPGEAKPSGETASETEIALGDMLSQLLEKLAALEETLQGETAPDADALDEIANLLAGVQDLMATTDLPMPGGGAFEKLNGMAASLGLVAQGSSGSENTNPFDALAALAAKIGKKAAEGAPDLSARLSDFASALDRHSVHMHAVAAENAEMPADTRKVILLSEVQSTPAKDIERAARATGQPVPADAEATSKPETAEVPPGTKRSLAKPDAGTQPDAANRQAPAPDAKAATQAAVQTASADAAAGQFGDADTVILPAGTQGASAGQAAASARAGQGAQPFAAQGTQINMQYVAAEITRQVQNGVNRFEIRMNPPELGRIDVRMEMDQSGNVIARLAVEKSETLDLMQRDQRALERALADAGLDSAKTELEFSLRQEGGNAEDSSDNASWSAGSSDQTNNQAPQATGSARTELYRSYVRPDGVNLWV